MYAYTDRHAYTKTYMQVSMQQCTKDAKARTYADICSKIKQKSKNSVQNQISFKVCEQRRYRDTRMPVVREYLCDLFNKSLPAGKFLEDWKIARIAPIFKNGAKDERSNYGPISILLFVTRLFDKLVFNQLYLYLDANKLLYAHQSGFRLLHSVTTTLLASTNDWYLTMDKGKYTGLIFIDLKKAFDTVDHAILLKKLKIFGVTGLEHEYFISYLNNRRQFCKTNGTSSQLKELSRGVPQGSCLGPLLFLIYINDLPFSLLKSNVSMHADDTAIYLSSKTLMSYKMTWIY